MEDKREAIAGLNYKYIDRSDQLIVNTFRNRTHCITQVNCIRNRRCHVPLFTIGYFMTQQALCATEVRRDFLSPFSRIPK
jgi:hypothetical protein